MKTTTTSIAMRLPSFTIATHILKDEGHDHDDDHDEPGHLDHKHDERVTSVGIQMEGAQDEPGDSHAKKQEGTFCNAYLDLRKVARVCRAYTFQQHFLGKQSCSFAVVIFELRVN